MFAFRFRLSRNTALIIVCLTLTLLSLVWHFVSFANLSPKGENTLCRVEFLEKLGYSARSDTESVKPIFLPESFDTVYTSYNQLQKKGGFDLSRYRGSDAELYTYKLEPLYDLREATVNLIIYKNRIIGGDISTIEKGGLCLPLVSAEENKKEIKGK